MKTLLPVALLLVCVIGVAVPASSAAQTVAAGDSERAATQSALDRLTHEIKKIAKESSSRSTTGTERLVGKLIDLSGLPVVGQSIQLVWVEPLDDSEGPEPPIGVLDALIQRELELLRNSRQDLTITTAEDGSFIVANLEPGRYEIHSQSGRVDCYLNGRYVRSVCTGCFVHARFSRSSEVWFDFRYANGTQPEKLAISDWPRWTWTPESPTKHLLVGDYSLIAEDPHTPIQFEFTCGIVPGADPHELSYVVGPRETLTVQLTGEEDLARRQLASAIVPIAGPTPSELDLILLEREYPESVRKSRHVFIAPQRYYLVGVTEDEELIATKVVDTTLSRSVEVKVPPPPRLPQLDLFVQNEQGDPLELSAATVCILALDVRPQEGDPPVRRVGAGHYTVPLSKMYMQRIESGDKLFVACFFLGGRFVAPITGFEVSVTVPLLQSVTLSFSSLPEPDEPLYLWVLDRFTIGRPFLHLPLDESGEIELQLLCGSYRLQLRRDSQLIVSNPLIYEAEVNVTRGVEKLSIELPKLHSVTLAGVDATHQYALYSCASKDRLEPILDGGQTVFPYVEAGRYRALNESTGEVMEIAVGGDGGFTFSGTRCNALEFQRLEGFPEDFPLRPADLILGTEEGYFADPITLPGFVVIHLLVPDDADPAPNKNVVWRVLRQGALLSLELTREQLDFLWKNRSSYLLLPASF